MQVTHEVIGVLDLGQSQTWFHQRELERIFVGSNIEVMDPFSGPVSILE